jgi:hypothetical protein
MFGVSSARPLSSCVITAHIFHSSSEKTEHVILALPLLCVLQSITHMERERHQWWVRAARRLIVSSFFVRPCPSGIAVIRALGCQLRCQLWLSINTTLAARVSRYLSRCAPEMQLHDQVFMAIQGGCISLAIPARTRCCVASSSRFVRGDQVVRAAHVGGAELQTRQTSGFAGHSTR